MMEFSKFLKIIKRHRITIVLVPLVAVIITYFLVRNQPDSYLSQTKLATGIVDQTQNLLNDGAGEQESKINQEFSNLIEMLKSLKILDQVAYKLIIHDLTGVKPYKQASPLLLQLNAGARQHALQVFTDKYNKREALSLFNPDQNGLNKLLISMDYDDKSLSKNLTIYRVQNSDYIDVQFESESPEISAFIVNSICEEFITYYTLMVKNNQRKAVDFYGNLLQAKKDTLNKRMDELKEYKIKNQVLNLNEKAKSIYGQIADFESRREDVDKIIQSTKGAINNIDKQFDPNDRRYLESNKIAITQQILSTRAQLQAANESYVKSNFDPNYKKQVDSLNKVVTSQIENLSDKYVLNPLVSKQNLIDQKLTLQIQNQLAEHSANAVNEELTRLNKEFKELVPREGSIQALESGITVASQEYLDVLAKYNQINMASKLSIQLRVIEAAEPGLPQPSKKMLLVFISGIVSFTFCIVIFFMLFFFDDTIKSSKELADKTKVPVLGHINLLSSKAIDMGDIWKNVKTSQQTMQLRNLMQSLRFEVSKELSNQKVLLINSIENAEGKTFVAVNLAYSYSSINKNVLVIDGNFSNPGITEISKTKFFLEDFLHDTIEPSFLSMDSKIKFLGNKGGEISLLEVSNDQRITEKFAALRAAFDVIIIEASSLLGLNKSKEWVAFSDKILTVFEAGNNINENYKSNIAYLKSTDEKFIGWVLNMVQDEAIPTDVKS